MRELLYKLHTYYYTINIVSNYILQVTQVLRCILHFIGRFSILFFKVPTPIVIIILLIYISMKKIKFILPIENVCMQRANFIEKFDILTYVLLII